MKKAPFIDCSKFKIDENLRFMTKWEKYNEVYYDYWLIGQVNEQGQPHGVARMITTGGLSIKEGSFVNGVRHGFGRLYV